MKKLKKIITLILDIYEQYIPMAMFAIIFVLYIIMIAYRYILHKQVAELVEASQVFYVVCALMAASYPGRTNSHAVFPLVYDVLKEKGKLVCRILGNLIVIVMSALMIEPTIEDIEFIAIKKTSLLKVPYDLLYTPFLIFIVLTMIYYAVALFKDIRSIFRKDGEAAPAEESKTE